MPTVILGPTPHGRYPRWGYLDRLESNECMPRALAAMLALLAAAGLGISGLRQMWPRADSPTAIESPRLPEVRFLRVPILPPPIAYKAREIPIPARRGKQGAIVPVDDMSDVPFETFGEPGGGTTPGERTGSQEGNAWDGDTRYAPASGAPEFFIAVEHEPQLVWMQPPEYPEIARDAGIEGSVLVRALVGADGAVERVLLLQGVIGLDEAALEAAMTAVFRPALQQGRPVPVWVVIPIDFSLHRSSAD